MKTHRTPEWCELIDELPQRVNEQPPMTALTPAEALQRAGLSRSQPASPAD